MRLYVIFMGGVHLRRMYASLRDIHGRGAFETHVCVSTEYHQKTLETK
jgi:hypothetical protein